MLSMKPLTAEDRETIAAEFLIAVDHKFEFVETRYEEERGRSESPNSPKNRKQS